MQRITVSLVAFGLLPVCLFAFGACGQEQVTPREQALMDAMQKLERRVADLEQQVQSLKQAPPSPAVSPAASSQAAPATAEGGKAPKSIEQRVSDLEKKGAESLSATWKDGLRFQSADGMFNIAVGGRLTIDYAWFSEDCELKDSVGDEQDGVNFRMARLNLQGDIYKNYFYRIEYEFAGNNGPTGFTDAYIGVKNIPYAGTLTLGHFKEPFGLEQLTNDSFTTFMERSLPSGAITPARNTGLMLSNAFIGAPGRERLSAQLGLFKPTDNWPSANDNDESQGWTVTGRLTGLPWYEDEGRKLLHVGLAYSHRDPKGSPINRYQIQTQPESRVSLFRYVNSEGFALFRLQDARAMEVNLYGAEAALVYGPFSLQSEYMMSDVRTAFDDTDRFSGYYAQASWFVTGENRAYRNGTGVFDRTRPKHNFAINKGTGAVELALRYAYVDLDSGGVHGGKEGNWTFGANWYFNPNMRLMLNYTLADIDHDFYKGELSMLQTRFQIDF